MASRFRFDTVEVVDVDALGGFGSARDSVKDFSCEIESNIRTYLLLLLLAGRGSRVRIPPFALDDLPAKFRRYSIIQFPLCPDINQVVRDIFLIAPRSLPWLAIIVLPCPFDLG